MDSKEWEMPERLLYTRLIRNERMTGAEDPNRMQSDQDRDNSIAIQQLLPLVYDELRKLADARLARESSGHSLQATALVHEVYVKLMGQGAERNFAGKGHFFAAAAQAMRQILVDRARRKLAVRHGEGQKLAPFPGDLAGGDGDPALAVAVDDLLDRLAAQHARSAEVAKMRLFLQMTFREIGEVLEISADTAETDWAYARAWLRRAWQAD